MKLMKSTNIIQKMHIIFSKTNNTKHNEKIIEKE